MALRVTMKRGLAGGLALGALALPLSACIPDGSRGPRAELTGSIPQSAPPVRRASTKEWSGEDGGSGSPEMTASAIRSAATNFKSCVAGMWPEAARRGVSQANFERLTADLSPDLKIMDFMDSQPEFTKAVWDYLDVLVTDARINRGREILAQFMPTVYKRFAVDFDHDGRRDAVRSIPDLIASTANKLKTDGWQPGQGWGYEVSVPRGFDYMMADRSKSLSLAQWERLGVRRAGGQAIPRPGDHAFFLMPAGAKRPGVLKLQNFRAILRYIPAEAYALAIGHLADRLRGGGPFVQNWPRSERVLSRAERLELQQLLARRGFYQGEPDGQLGSATRKALRSYQASVGAPADGFASSDSLDRLRAN